MSRNREIRAEAILDKLREISGEPRAIAEVAEMLGRLPGASFGMDLALARQMALDVGEVITPCTWDAGYLGDGVSEEVTHRGSRRKGDEQGAFVLYHLMPGHENDRMTGPMLTKTADAITRVRNAGRYGEWQAKNGEDRMVRRLAKAVSAHAQSSEEVFRALAEMCDEVRVLRRGRTN